MPPPMNHPPVPSGTTTSEYGQELTLGKVGSTAPVVASTAEPLPVSHALYDVKSPPT